MQQRQDNDPLAELVSPQGVHSKVQPSDPLAELSPQGKTTAAPSLSKGMVMTTTPSDPLADLPPKSDNLSDIPANFQDPLGELFPSNSKTEMISDLGNAQAAKSNTMLHPEDPLVELSQAGSSTVPIPKPDSGNSFIEGGKQIVGGVRDAMQELGEFGQSITDNTIYPALEAVGVEKTDLPDFLTAKRSLPEVEQPKDAAGALVRGASQFLTGFTPVNKALQGAQVVNKVGTTAKAAVSGLLADTAVFDPHDGRLSNLVEEYPALRNPITEYLAASPDDTEAEGRFKNAMEGLALGGMTDGLLQALKYTTQNAPDAVTGFLKSQTPDAGSGRTASETLRDGTSPSIAEPKNGAGLVAEDFKSDPNFSGAAKNELSSHLDYEIDLTGPQNPANVTAPSQRPGGTDGEIYQIERFENPQSAGFETNNIRVDKLQTAEDIDVAINTIAEANGVFDEARRGVVSDEELRGLADDLRITPEQLAKRKRGQALNAEQLLASRQLLATSGDELVALAQKARGGTDEDILAFQRVLIRHTAIQGQVSGAVAEAGRALRQQRLIAQSDKLKGQALKELIDNQGGRANIEDMADKIAAIDDPAAMNEFARKAMTPKLADKVQEYWINALLSGPTTHMVNMTSNGLTILWSVAEDFATAGIGKLHGGEKMFAREPLARAYGAVEGAKDGLRAFSKAVRTGEGFDDLTKFSDNHRQALNGPIGDVVNIPTGLLNAEDSFFKAFTYRTEINALSVRQAAREGLKGRAFAERVAGLRNTPTDNMVETATERARVLTFTNQLGKAGSAVSHFRNNVPGARWVVPFLKTPMNILKFATKRTPLGLAMKEVREDLAKGGLSRDRVIAQISLGSTVSLATVSQAIEGNITGGGPSDWKERQALMATGWRPYSIKLGDEWVTYNRLDPLGMIMGLSADVAEVIQKSDEIDAEEAAAALAIAFAKTLLDKSYLRGIADLTNAMHNPDRYGKRYLQNFAASFVPNAVGQVARSQDPIIRETRTFVDLLKARIPGLSESLYPKRDFWGEPIRRDGGVYGDGVAGRLLSPAKSAGTERDFTTQELLRLELSPSKTSKSLSGVELTPTQYDEFQQYRGRLTKRALDKFVNGPAYEGMPDAGKRFFLEKIMKFGGNMATTAMHTRYPELKQLAETEKYTSMKEARKKQKIEQAVK